MEAGTVVVELAARAGVLQADENRKIKRMVFVLDPRAYSPDLGTCPELVIRGVRRGQRDALELVPDVDEGGGFFFLQPFFFCVCWEKKQAAKKLTRVLRC